MDYSNQKPISIRWVVYGVWRWNMTGLSAGSVTRDFKDGDDAKVYAAKLVINPKPGCYLSAVVCEVRKYQLWSKNSGCKAGTHDEEVVLARYGDGISWTGK